MSAETESAEIIRRRLFEWGGLPEDGRKVALEYADWAIDHATELSGVDASNARELFLASYPFHPAVLSVFERKWQSLPPLSAYPRNSAAAGNMGGIRLPEGASASWQQRRSAHWSRVSTDRGPDFPRRHV